MDWGSGEVEGLAEPVLEVAGIGEMGVFGVVAEEDEGRRVGPHLVGVDDLEPAVVELRGRVHLLGVGDYFVQNGCRDAPAARLIRLLDGRKDGIEVPPRFGRSEDDFGEREELKPRPDLLLKLLLHRPGRVGVPLVDGDDDGLLRLQGVAGHVAILIQNAFFSVDDQDGDLAAVDGPHGPQGRVFVYRFVNPPFFDQSGGVDGHKIA